MPIFLIIVFVVIFALVFALKEKKSINKHKKNLNYTAGNVVVDVEIKQEENATGQK